MMIINPFVLGAAAPSPLTFPEVQNFTYSSPAAGTSHSISVTAAAGERVILCLAASNTCTIDAPVGWTSLVYRGTGHTLRIYWIDAVSAITTITVTTSISVGIQALAYKIKSGTFSSEAPVANSAAATSTAPNPPSTNYGSPGAFLVFAICDFDNQTSISGYPYLTNRAAQTRVLPPHCGIGGCAATSENQVNDPGTFTLAASNPWVAATVIQKGP